MAQNYFVEMIGNANEETIRAYAQNQLKMMDKLESISNNKIENIFRRIPNELISEPAINFALALLEANKKRLLSLKKDY